jgi:hypothetical protein
VCPREPEAEQDDEQFGWVPTQVDQSARLCGLDSGDGLFVQELAVSLRAIKRQTFEARPCHHAEVFGSPAGDVEDLPGEFRRVLELEFDCTEQRRTVGGDYLAEQRILVAEVGVQTFLAGIGGLGDAVYARTGETVLRELRPRGIEDLVAELRGGAH